MSLEKGAGFKMHHDADRRFRRWRLGAALAVALLGFAIVTPLCGALFGCGCTWPWSGMDAPCNVHDPAAPHHCPWCVRPEIKALTATVASALAALTTWVIPRRARSARVDLALRATLGIGAYLAVSALGAHLASSAAGYPHFLWW